MLCSIFVTVDVDVAVVVHVAVDGFSFGLWPCGHCRLVNVVGCSVPNFVETAKISPNNLSVTTD
jgi:hypothetical protein